MRILCVTPWFPEHPNAQAGRFVLDSLSALRGLGHAVKVIVSHPWRPAVAGRLCSDWQIKPVDPSLYPGEFGLEVVRHVSFPRNYLRGLSNRLYHAAVVPRLSSAVTAFRPDIIHAHNELPASAALAVATPMGLPVCVTLHGQAIGKRVETLAYRAFQANVLSSVGRVVLVGEPLRAAFAGLVADDSRMRVVHNGVALPPKVTERRDDRAALRDQCVRLISVSNLHEGKGIDLNLRALAILLESGRSNWRYTVVGDGRERPALEKLARELRLTDRVRFVGRCGFEEVICHLQGADVFMLPSYREAFGIAYLEAMACGLLTIGVEGQGPSAFITHGKTGLLVPARDVAALADCLRLVLERPASMSGIAAAGRDLVEREFSWSRHAERLTEVYQELIQA